MTEEGLANEGGGDDDDDDADDADDDVDDGSSGDCTAEATIGAGGSGCWIGERRILLLGLKGSKSMAVLGLETCEGTNKPVSTPGMVESIGIIIIANSDLRRYHNNNPESHTTTSSKKQGKWQKERGEMGNQISTLSLSPAVVGSLERDNDDRYGDFGSRRREIQKQRPHTPSF